MCVVSGGGGERRELRVIVFVVVVILVFVRRRGWGRWCDAHHGRVWGKGHAALGLGRSHGTTRWDHAAHVHVLLG